MRKTGRCFCGEVKFEYEAGTEKFMGHCHCESCRRAIASPFASVFGIPDGKWQWTGVAPKTYNSSPNVIRSFCQNCGTPMAYQSKRLPEEIHFYAANLDDQTSFKPEANYNSKEMVYWVKQFEDLPNE